MKTSTLLASLLISMLAFTSCNKSDDNKYAPLKSEEDQLKDAADVTDFAAKIPANNYTLVQSNLTNDQQNEMYTVGCKNPGTPYGGSSKDEMEAQLVGRRTNFYRADRYADSRS